jgi:hypothetical protein
MVWTSANCPKCGNGELPGCELDHPALSSQQDQT